MERQLETERLLLRRVTLGDADLMLAVWNDPAFVANVGDRGVRTIEEAESEMQAGALKSFEEFGFGPFAMVRKSDGERIGICGLFKRPNLDDPDIGFAALPDYCGRGYTAEAAQAVVDHARDDLGLETLTAIVSSGNAPSIGLIEKLGLSFVGMIRMPEDDEDICLYSMALARK